MSAARIDCQSVESRNHLLRSWHAAILEVHGVVDVRDERGVMSMPMFDEKGRAGRFEVRPFGERFVELEIIRE